MWNTLSILTNIKTRYAAKKLCVHVCLLCEGEGGGGGDRDFTLGGSQSTSFGKRCLPFDLFLHSVLTKMNP